MKSSWAHAAVFFSTLVSGLPSHPPSAVDIPTKDITTVAGTTGPDYITIHFRAACQGCGLDTQDGLDLTLEIDAADEECGAASPRLNGVHLELTKGNNVANGQITLKTDPSNGLAGQEVHASWQSTCLKGEASIISVRFDDVTGQNNVEDAFGFTTSFKQKGKPTVLRLQDKPIDQISSESICDEWLLPEDQSLSIVHITDDNTSSIDAQLDVELLKLQRLKEEIDQLHEQMRGHHAKVMSLLKQDFKSCSSLKCLWHTAVNKAPTIKKLISLCFSHHKNQNRIAGCTGGAGQKACLTKGKDFDAPPPSPHEPPKPSHGAIDGHHPPPPFEGKPRPPFKGEHPPPPFERPPSHPPAHGDHRPPPFEGGHHPPPFEGDHPHPPLDGRPPPPPAREDDPRPPFEGDRPHPPFDGPPPHPPSHGDRPPFGPPDGPPQGMPPPPPGHHGPPPFGPHGHPPGPPRFGPFGPGGERHSAIRLALAVITLILLVILSGLTFRLIQRSAWYRDPRRQADRAARREERRTRKLYRKAACKHKWSTWLKRYQRHCSANDYEEKREMILEQEGLLDDVMQNEIRTLRDASDLVRDLVRVEEGRARRNVYNHHQAACPYSPAELDAGVGSSNPADVLPLYAAPPPRYEEELEGELTVVDGFRYTPSNTDATSDSSIVDCSPRLSLETGRSTVFTKDARG